MHIYVWLIVVFVASVSAQNDTSKNASDALTECKNIAGVENEKRLWELVAKGLTNNVICFQACLIAKGGKNEPQWNDDGTAHVNNTIKVIEKAFGNDKNKEIRINAVKQCADERGKDFCETVIKHMNCKVRAGKSMI